MLKSTSCRWAWAPVLLLLAFAAGCGGDTRGQTETVPTDDAFRAMVFAEPLQKAQFMLADTEGKPYDFYAETQGYITLLYFGYTFCADICPTHMADIAAVLKRDGELKENVKTVFVTVDPERDTPERLTNWLALFESDIVGLTGTPEEIDTALKASLGSQYFPVKTFDRDGEGDMSYTVSHAAFVIAYGKDNQGPVAFPVRTSRDDYTHDLKLLLNKGES